MKVIEILKISGDLLKLMSENDVMRDDYRYIEMYDEFVNMRSLGVKYSEAVRLLSEDYGISKTTIERAMSRLSREVSPNVKRPQKVKSKRL